MCSVIPSEQILSFLAEIRCSSSVSSDYHAQIQILRYTSKIMDKIIERGISREACCEPKEVIEIEEGIQHTTYKITCKDEEYILQYTDNQNRALDLLHRNAYWYDELEKFYRRLIFSVVE